MRTSSGKPNERTGYRSVLESSRRALSTVFVMLYVLAGCSSGPSEEGTTRVEVSADPLTIKPGATSTVTVRVVGPDGEAAPDGTPVELSVSPALGALTNAEPTTVAGEAKTLFTAGASAGQTIITATSGTVSAEVMLTIGARAPASISIHCDPGTLKTGDSSTVVVEVLEADGVAVPDGTAVALSVAPAFGILADTALPTVAGKVATTFTAGTSAGQVAINAMSGTATASVSLTIEPRTPATLRLVVDNNPANLNKCGNWDVYCILAPVQGYIQPLGGGERRWMPAIGPSETAEVSVPEAGQRFRWVFKACEMTTSSSGSYTLVWEGETDILEGSVVTIRIDADEARIFGRSNEEGWFCEQADFW